MEVGLLRSMASCLYGGKTWNFELNISLREKLVGYIEKNEEEVRKILQEEGATFATCISYSALNEFKCLVSGNPYIYYNYNEVDPNDSNIKISFYPKVLKDDIYKGKIWIKGEYKNITFDRMTYNVKVECDPGVQTNARLNPDNTCCGGYVELTYYL
ncbi:Hypothetical protein ORPV_410 [Orpheovirus IHUMI-LCC2]|uniref:Uncharacterized protein n=1 Tax=Orpheovirus IHUMI-LCC2 TaxID=2023057 RepID=A0A2I2L459_9VIRU|nr:Hypothetical protein ORPV_410 [Orpheovirus IHUMI-LCC2]SNW62314.1 Hypothetical protein ORPV_410 [Orpheovirus IHUMI-LCC2]